MGPALLCSLLSPLSWFSVSPAFGPSTASECWQVLAWDSCLLQVPPLSTKLFKQPSVNRMIVFIVTVAVGIQERPDAAPQTGPWSSDYKIVNSPSFAKGMAAICQLTFAFTGTPFFFPIVSEMRDPRYYTRSLTICQSVVTVTYIVIGVVVYYYCGSYVSSPALGSAGKLIKQIAYGIALPGLFATSTISTHVGRLH